MYKLLWKAYTSAKRGGQKYLITISCSSDRLNDAGDVVDYRTVDALVNRAIGKFQGTPAQLAELIGSKVPTCDEVEVDTIEEGRSVVVKYQNAHEQKGERFNG